jgi:O-glycosyl hydrolase
MRKRLILLAVVISLFANSYSQNTVKVEKKNLITTNNGYWEGWGTSLCWWANRIGYNPTLTKQSAELFFDSKKGLGLNIMRYNIGGGDDPTHNHITRTDSDVPGWQYYNAETGEYEYDYNADFRQLNVLKAASKAAGQDAYIEVFSNSPPYFMTVSGCSTGNFKSEEDNIRADAYDDFAEYLAHVTHYMMKKLKLDVKSISPMNEPNTNYWPAFNYKQEGCHIDAGESQSKLLVETKKALTRYGIDNIILTASDETNPGKQIEEIKLMTPQARAAINRISAHTYGVNGIRELGQLAKEENINLWMSEVDGNGTAGTNAGEMSAALWLANKIINDITAMEPSAWVLWQVIDTHVSKEGYKGRVDKGPLQTMGGYWGTAYANHDTEEIVLTQKYYAFGHFSKYIRPGSSLIICNNGLNRGCNAIAAIDNKGKQITVVCTNTTANNQNMNIDLSDFHSGKSKVTHIRTSGSMSDGEQWNVVSSNVICENSKLNIELLPNSISTYIFTLK